MKYAIVLGHGSRNGSSSQEFISCVNRVREITTKNHNYQEIKHAYLEFQTPTLCDTILELVNDGAKEIVIQPCFLFKGNHVCNNIPKIVEDEKKKHPNISIKLAPHIGYDEVICNVIVERITSV